MNENEIFSPLFVRFNRQEMRAFEFEGRVCNGSYIWRIENYRQRRQDAINGIATAVHSPAFYTCLLYTSDAADE